MDENGIRGVEPAETSTWDVQGHIDDNKGVRHHFSQTIITMRDRDGMSNEEFIHRLMNTYPVGIACKRRKELPSVTFLPWTSVRDVDVTSMVKREV